MNFSSRLVRISATAKSPMSMGRMLKPEFRSMTPKVKRVKLVMGAMPTKARIKPIMPLMMPLTMEPEASETIIVRENRPMEKYS